MTDKPFEYGYFLLVDQNVSNVAHFDKEFSKNLILFLCPPQVKNYVTTITNSQPFKILFQKCKSCDLTENTYNGVQSKPPFWLFMK